MCLTMARKRERHRFAAKLTYTLTVISKSAYLFVKSVTDAKARSAVTSKFLKPKKKSALFKTVTMQHANEQKLGLFAVGAAPLARRRPISSLPKFGAAFDSDKFNIGRCG